MKNKKNNNKGFTLIELSVVIVILGLIIAGVTSGQSLVHAAQLRQVMNTVSESKAAIVAFKGQYKALPGDMKTASTFLSGAVNGNGSGSWENASGTGWDMTKNPENFALWQQLTLAKLFPGSYTGAIDTVNVNKVNDPTGCTSNGSGNVPGKNVPKLPTGQLDSLNAYSGNFWAIMPPMDVLFIIKANCWTSTITTKDAYSIDVKMDDGQPYTGFVAVTNGGSTHCLAQDFNTGYANTPALRAAVNYDFTVAGGVCEVMFPIGEPWR